jgi:uncharacterized membrane protein
MSSVEQHIDVCAPVSAAYKEWTQFERLPRFMAGVDEVRQLDETHLRWRAFNRGAAEGDWEIVELRPEERIAWRSTSGVPHGGVVTFHRLDAHETRVMVIAEIDAGAPDLVEARVRDTLGCFKQIVERR